MKKARIALLAAIGLIGIEAYAAADVVTGTVENVNTADNKITLRRTNPPQGEPEKVTISWKDYQPGL